MKYISIIAFLVFAFFPHSEGFARKSSATIIYVKGAAQVLRSKPKYEQAKVGMNMTGGDTVKVGPKSKLKIIYPNGETLFIGQNTHLELPVSSRVAEEEISTLNLIMGKLRILISPEVSKRERFYIRTPSAVTGVRGTDLFIEHIKGQGTHISVLHGSVEAVSHTHIGTLEAGYRMSTGKKSEKSNLPKVTFTPFTNILPMTS